MGRRPLSRLLLVAPLALLAACATLSRQPISEDARRTVALLTSRASEFTDLRALADIAVKRGSDRLRVQGVEPRVLLDVVDVPSGDPLHQFLADASIPADERLALVLAGPAFQWR